MTRIENIVNEHLGKEAVASVEITRKMNSDGEPVFWLTIVLTKGAKIASHKMIELTDKLWAAELASESSSFPIIDYIAHEDVVGGRAA